MTRKLSMLGRRDLLRAAGLGTAATLLPSLRRAEAASGIPTRFVVFYTQHGTLPEPWKPTGPGGVGAASETSFDLGELHQPLASFKKDLILLSGLDMRSWADGPQVACGHVNGQVASLTNFDAISKGNAGGPSIDQYIAAGLKKQNGGVSPTKLPSMNLAAAGDGYFGQAAFFSGPGALVPIESSPTRAYQRLFPNGTSPSTTGPSLDALAAARRRSAAMDVAMGEFAAVENLLGKAEKTKLEAHAAAIKDLQTRLSKAPGGGGTSCMAPTAPAAKVGFRDGGDAMIRMIQAGFACDLTRVASLWMGSTPNADCGYSPGMLGTTDLHDLVHKVDGDMRSNPTAVGVIKKFHIAYSQVFAQLLTALKAIPESDGSTMLDHTVILWAGEIAQGGHGCANLKWMLAGSAGGYFKTGRYLNWGDYNRGEYGPDRNGPSNGDLFSSLANAMGVPTTTYGSNGRSTGPIAKLRG
ncbi:MAG: DUF1552 domain-containing protein [Deltaproteobacteria bacterium]|nr:DUF1552 domain-containing protein [Deltaproteobacteria bacterium]